MKHLEDDALGVMPQCPPMILVVMLGCPKWFRPRSRLSPRPGVYTMAKSRGGPAPGTYPPMAEVNSSACIAPGILIAGLISAVIGMQLPGPSIIYMGQGLKFLATVTVKELEKNRNRTVLETVCYNLVSKEGGTPGQGRPSSCNQCEHGT